MADDKDAAQYFRRWARREYLTKHEQQPRASAKAEGARRIDVTLSAEALSDYATVRSFLEGVNRTMAERNLPGTPFRLSATEIINAALRQAAAAIEEEERAAKTGLRPARRC
jgi:hypothetical protein